MQIISYCRYRFVEHFSDLYDLILSKFLGPVVQSIVSLTSSLVVKILTVLVRKISNSQLFFFCWKKKMSSFCKCKSYSHFFSKNISIYDIFNGQSFNYTLTNDIVSFEQLGLEHYYTCKVGSKFHTNQWSSSLFNIPCSICVYIITNLEIGWLDRVQFHRDAYESFEQFDSVFCCTESLFLPVCKFTQCIVEWKLR